MDYDFNVTKLRRTIAPEAEASGHAGYAFQFDRNAQAALLMTFFKGLSASLFDLAWRSVSPGKTLAVKKEHFIEPA